MGFEGVGNERNSIFTSDSREQLNEMFSWNVHFINNKLSQYFFFPSKNLKQNHETIYNDPFTIILHHFVDDSADA